MKEYRCKRITLHIKLTQHWELTIHQFKTKFFQNNRRQAQEDDLGHDWQT